jgi:2-oxo-4-hydroxy-4-carboxy-5-ureidoimidazoline decarboxylase
MSYIEEWNAMSDNAAAEAVLPCCGSHAWARGLAARRPLSTLPELLAASDAAWWSLAEADWQEAFDSHPRIGEQHPVRTATNASLAWSAGEQQAADLSDGTAKAVLAEGQREYEAKFGHIFIVCATGKTSREMLDILMQRMQNTPEAELRETAEQQREITHIRLRKWLAQHEGAQQA